MDFQQARDAHLRQFDDAVVELRQIIISPDWCNMMYPPYKKAVEHLFDAIKAIERLNGVAFEGQRVIEALKENK